jgi:hypothetical protein
MRLASTSIEAEDSFEELDSVELIEISEAEVEWSGLGLKTSTVSLSLEESSAFDEDSGWRMPRLLPPTLSKHPWKGDPWQLLEMAQGLQHPTRVSIDCARCGNSVHLVARNGRWLPGVFCDYELSIPAGSPQMPAQLVALLAELHRRMKQEAVIHPALEPGCIEVFQEIDALARKSREVNAWLAQVTARALLDVCAQGGGDDGISTSVVPEGLSHQLDGYLPMELMMWAAQASSVSGSDDAAWRFRQSMNSLQIPTWSFVFVEGHPWLIGSTQTAIPDWEQARLMARLLLDMRRTFEAMGHGQEKAVANTWIRQDDVLQVVVTDRYATYSQAAPRLMGVMISAARAAMHETRQELVAAMG